MKIVNHSTGKASILVTSLNGHIDNEGNIHAIATREGWSLVSDQCGVDHYVKTNRYNCLRAKHKFVNNTGEAIVLKWSVNIITSDGQNLKYDFGTITIKPWATQFSISTPYKYSHSILKNNVSRVMVALMII